MALKDVKIKVLIGFLKSTVTSLTNHLEAGAPLAALEDAKLIVRTLMRVIDLSVND
jgi:hypothetical protein